MAAKTQDELVKERLLEREVGQELIEEIETPGSSVLHLLEETEAVSFIEMVLKLRKNIQKFCWYLVPKYRIDRGYEVEAKLRYPGLDQLYNKPRREIAETFLSIYNSSDDVVGITWEVNKPYILVQKDSGLRMNPEELKSKVEITYILEQFGM